MALTLKEEAELKHYISRVGEMTSTEALMISLEAEQTAKDCGPLDIAYTRFVADAKGFLHFADLLDKAGK